MEPFQVPGAAYAVSILSRDNPIMQVPSSTLFLMFLYHKLSTVLVKIRKKPAYQLSIFLWHTSNFSPCCCISYCLLGIISFTSIKFNLYIIYLCFQNSTCLEKRGIANDAF
ncbi:hypothetical protein F4813DRAFT_71554 [Daldinia decipiens]|uniref:uncharacterized protein n=1 Tax=Daldinia decipiens TaxID=326647 RepID=UPI0020C20CA5|nr:uncharacterized protein F4813DRAFT_71554 [Daldinia decipiens]KAI1657671.1 hypothetical protein F4813DRAFT_71554 [Daldinia decipiens]